MWFVILLIAFLLILSGFIYKALNIPIPHVTDRAILSKTALKKSNTLITFEHTFCKKNKFGIYEVYAEGAPFERGYAMGQVVKDLKYEHEKNFIDSIYQLVPSKIYVHFLRIVIGILNRNLHHYFKPEYKEEMLGLSYASSSDFNYIAPPYQRVLNYHAAHDIGHALQNIGLVGCSSFVVNDTKSVNGELILARNLDFSPSEKFNELKAIYFINPDKGYKYISYSWPGFIGVVSGMNEYGLCVVLHSAKSKPRLRIGTPVSIIARQIMQEAKNLKEAENVLKNSTSFVSEFFLIVSAQDKSACVFEKEPTQLSKYEMEGNELICTNHYLSDEKKDATSNIKWKNSISSAYREKRLKELLAEKDTLTPEHAVEILRDIKGLNNDNIGIQNECAINQLAAHHGIVFQPESLHFWLSANPYCMGEMIAYNFNDAFTKAQQNPEENLFIEEKNIAADSFLKTEAYHNFLAHKRLTEKVKNAIKHKTLISKDELALLIAYNKHLYLSYECVGDYYVYINQCSKAKELFAKALSLKIPTIFERNRIDKKHKKC